MAVDVARRYFKEKVSSELKPVERWVGDALEKVHSLIESSKTELELFPEDEKRLRLLESCLDEAWKHLGGLAKEEEEKKSRLLKLKRAMAERKSTR